MSVPAFDYYCGSCDLGTDDWDALVWVDDITDTLCPSCFEDYEVAEEARRDWQAARQCREEAYMGIGRGDE